MPTLSNFAALLAAALLGATALFQLALAVGAPWGAYAWGGAHAGRLPGRLRAGSAVSAGFLGFVAFVLLAQGGVLAWSPLPEAFLVPVTWALAALFALNTLGNLAAKSAFERFAFGGATGILVVLCAILALTGSGPA